MNYTKLQMFIISRRLCIEIFAMQFLSLVDHAACKSQIMFLKLHEMQLPITVQLLDTKTLPLCILSLWKQQ